MAGGVCFGGTSSKIQSFSHNHSRKALNQLPLKEVMMSPILPSLCACGRLMSHGCPGLRGCWPVSRPLLPLSTPLRVYQKPDVMVPNCMGFICCCNDAVFLNMSYARDFPGGPVVKTPHSLHRGTEFDP